MRSNAIAEIAKKPQKTLKKATVLAKELYPLAIEGNNLKTINNVIATAWAKGKVYVYVLYKARRIFAHWDKKIMYIGITNNPARRIVQHNENEKKHGHFTHVAIVYYASETLRNIVAHAEALIITDLEPELNELFNKSKDKKYQDPRKITHFVENKN